MKGIDKAEKALIKICKLLDAAANTRETGLLHLRQKASVIIDEMNCNFWRKNVGSNNANSVKRCKRKGKFTTLLCSQGFQVSRAIRGTSSSS